jgi:hypothetical protein
MEEQNQLELDLNDILIAEYQYIAQSAFQANEDRARVSNYYFVTAAAAVAAIIGAKFEGYSTTGVYLGFGAMFLVLSLIGLLTLLQLARLRAAWAESARAMNRIKQFYFDHFQGMQIETAFAWTSNSLPSASKKRSLAFLLALSVIVVDCTTLITAVIYLIAATGAAPMQAVWLAAGLAIGSLSGVIQYIVYHRWLEH